MIWDQATVDELKTLHARGVDYVEIGRRMGCSKGTIAGKVNRLELKKQPSPIIKGPYNGAATSHRGVITTEEQERRILLMTGFSDRKCAEVIGVSRYVVNRVRRPQRETARAARAALPELASLSSLVPTPAFKLFQTVAAPVLSIADRDRRILLMANRTDGQCARLLGISRNVVRHVRAKDRLGTAPEAAAPVAKSPCVTIVAAPEPRAAPTPPPSQAIPATYHHSAPSSCQWPIGVRTSVYHIYRACGCTEVVPGKPYCAFHAALAYVRVRERGGHDYEVAL